jgi:hypothetical protein
MAAGARSVLYVAGAAEAVLYLLALTGTIDNWWFGIVTYAGVVLLPAIAQAVKPAAMSPVPVEDKPVLERVGIDEPYTERVRAMLDERLGLPARANRPSAPSAAAAPAQHVGIPAEATT